jgi:AcrR family transcriptional regulator
MLFKVSTQWICCQGSQGSAWGAIHRRRDPWYEIHGRPPHDGWGDSESEAIRTGWWQLSDEQATAAAPTSPRMRGDDRRRKILQALHDCVIERGYAKTTLADVARSAGMSPSHLLYYFDGTDAILAQYFSNVGQRLIERLDGFSTEPPDRQIHLLADLFFAGKAVKKSEVGFMLECFGVAVHDKRLWREKTALDEYCKTYLRQLFEKSPAGPENAGTSAELAYAMLIGLRTVAYFDEKIGPTHARRLFHAAMLDLAKMGQVD